MEKKLYRSKTVWTGVIAVVAGLAGYFTGSMEAGVAIQTAFTGLIGIFLRNGMMNKGG